MFHVQSNIWAAICNKPNLLLYHHAISIKPIAYFNEPWRIEQPKTITLYA